MLHQHAPIKYLHYLSYCLLLMLFSNLSFAEGISTATFKDINGKQHQYTDFKGQWLIVNYWATWCPPCLEEIPELLAFQENHPKELAILGMDLEEIETDKLSTFADEYFMDYPIIPIEEARKAALGSIKGLPTTFIINPEGKIAVAHIGAITQKDLLKYTQLKEKP